MPALRLNNEPQIDRTSSDQVGVLLNKAARPGVPAHHSARPGRPTDVNIFGRGRLACQTEKASLGPRIVVCTDRSGHFWPERCACATTAARRPVPAAPARAENRSQRREFGRIVAVSSLLGTCSESHVRASHWHILRVEAARRAARRRHVTRSGRRPSACSRDSSSPATRGGSRACGCEWACAIGPSPGAGPPGQAARKGAGVREFVGISATRSRRAKVRARGDRRCLRALTSEGEGRGA